MTESKKKVERIQETFSKSVAKLSGVGLRLFQKKNTRKMKRDKAIWRICRLIYRLKYNFLKKYDQIRRKEEQASKK